MIWHSALPHGNGLNTDDTPRLEASYLSMWPAGDQGASGTFQQRASPQEERAHRIKLFEDRVSAGCWVENPPFDRMYEQETQPQPPQLTELAEKLLGLKEW